jgi:hypothetical protein
MTAERWREKIISIATRMTWQRPAERARNHGDHAAAKPAALDADHDNEKAH